MQAQPKLDERDGAGVGFGALESGLLDQKCRYDAVDDLQDGREQLGMRSEQQAKGDRKREHPLPHRHPGNDVIEQVGGGLRHAPGAARVHSRGAEGDNVLEADLVVHGAGRVPNTARLRADAGHVRLDHRGCVEVNEFLQSTTNPRVYAAGDVALPSGSLPLTPVAAHEGAVVASNLLKGNRERPDYRGLPTVVFTLPPLASAGLTEKSARERSQRPGRNR